MSLFRRRMMMAGVGGGDNYDYITDGLILHLDGMWNGGIGTHLASTDTWVDLSSAGNNATSINGTSISFGNDYADFTTADGFASLVGLAANVSFTIEVWYKTNFSNRYAVGCWGYNNKYSFGCSGSIFQYMGAGSPLNTGVAFYNHGAVTYDKNTPLFSLYENDILKNSYNVSAGTGQNNATPAIGINRKFDSNQSWAGKVYMFRMYDRVLSANEISHNYNEDIKRLGK